RSPTTVTAGREAHHPGRDHQPGADAEADQEHGHHRQPPHRSSLRQPWDLESATRSAAWGACSDRRPSGSPSWAEPADPRSAESAWATAIRALSSSTDSPAAGLRTPAGPDLALRASTTSTVTA